MTAGVLRSVLVVAAIATPALARDPAAWGGDHVGQPVPTYEDGNACLFCHRTSIGPSWQTNRHATTIRGIGDEPRARKAAETINDAEFVLGRDALLRLLKRGQSYGTLSIHESKSNEKVRDGKWNDTRFGERCAGCHTSGVDSVAKTFQMVSLDCHTCHGLAVPEHTEDGALMLFSKGAGTRPEVEVSICGSCHLRGGTSRSTGLPFPNNFVPGDNLFRDFRVDLSSSESAGDEHIFMNVRDIAEKGETQMTCTTCHAIHAQSSQQHTKLPAQPLCFTCHVEGQPMTRVKTVQRHSRTCDY